jgi:hypothetical protein
MVLVVVAAYPVLEALILSVVREFHQAAGLLVDLIAFEQSTILRERLVKAVQL